MYRFFVKLSETGEKMFEVTFGLRKGHSKVLNNVQKKFFGA
jgi:hypothetical protein